jgi:polyphenol oxidase
MEAFQRRPLWEGGQAIVSVALERAGFLAAFMERTGGVSRPPFDSLNVSYSVGDDPGAVGANRRRASKGLRVSGFAVPGLIHRTSILPVGPARAADGFRSPPTVLRRADGLSTRRAYLPLGAFSADCVIAVMADPARGRVALVHAGWRGLAAGMVRKAAGVFPDRQEVRVAIGPAIGPCHYEVGEEVVRAVAAASPAGAIAERRHGTLYLDLVSTTRAMLREEGIRWVDDTGLCTACHPDQLFSFRGEGRTGRHLAVAMRFPEA